MPNGEMIEESGRLETAAGETIAYRSLRRKGGSADAPGATTPGTTTPGTTTPGILFLHGFRSDMNGTKAEALAGWCRENGIAFTRYDAFGHGASSGAFVEGTIGQWAEDALAVIDKLTEGPLVLVGSSMGGWLMLLAALARPARVAGLVGLAPAPDFTEALIHAHATDEQRAALAREGQFVIPDCYGESPFVITRKLIEEGRRHLLLDAPIPLACPVRLIHGMKDADVPWPFSPRLAERLASADVRVTLIKDAGHRLSASEEIAVVLGEVEDILSLLPHAPFPRRRESSAV